MNLSQRDRKLFALHHARYEEDGHGDGRNVYDEPPAAEFRGNIQHAGEKADTQGYGIERKYAYVVYTSDDKGFTEKDRFTDGVKWYEIKTIQRWSSHVRLFVEEVTACG